MSKIFGLTEDQLMEQLRKCGDSHEVDPESKMGPIKPGETFEPCLRGSEKILNDPELKEMMHRIYRGIPIEED